jgi:hypothetical protein
MAGVAQSRDPDQARRLNASRAQPYGRRRAAVFGGLSAGGEVGTVRLVANWALIAPTDDAWNFGALDAYIGDSQRRGSDPSPSSAQPPACSREMGLAQAGLEAQCPLYRRLVS